MKQYVFLIGIILAVSTNGKAQTNPIAQQAKGITQFFSDTLHTTAWVSDSIYAINLQLGAQKLRVWETQTHPDSVKLQLQQIENMRNVLYKPLLDRTQYAQYLKRKNEILRAY